MATITPTTVQSLGVTAHLTPMPNSQMKDWEFVTDNLHGTGPVRAYIVTHADRGELGLIFAKGRDCHAEWLMPEAGEYLYAGAGRTLQYAVAAILNAHESNGRPVMPAVEEEVATPTPALTSHSHKAKAEDQVEREAASAILAAATGGITAVVYRGRHTSLHRGWFAAVPCGPRDRRCPCKGFELFSRSGRLLVEHVRPQHLEVTLEQDLWGSPGA